jgi:hypothetical protein
MVMAQQLSIYFVIVHSIQNSETRNRGQPLLICQLGVQGVCVLVNSVKAECVPQRVVKSSPACQINEPLILWPWYCFR